MHKRTLWPVARPQSLKHRRFVRRKGSRYDLPRSGERPIYAAVAGGVPRIKTVFDGARRRNFANNSGSTSAPKRSTSADGSRRMPASTKPGRNGFLADHERAARGELDSWKAEPSSALALILLLDQFPRNIFRSTPRAFATDSRALATAKEAIERGFDLALPPVRRPFIYLPFHTENVDDQHESVRLFRKLAADDPATAGYVPVRRPSPGSDPPIRPLPASQRRAGPGVDPRRERFPLKVRAWPNSSGLVLGCDRERSEKSRAFKPSRALPLSPRRPHH